ncbi:MAG TPA: MFS transporter [Ktedonobacterales bacterium]
MDSTTAGALAPDGVPGARRRGKPGLLINRDFALLWLGQTVSVTGDMMFNTTLVIWIALGLTAHISWSPVAVSAVLIAAAAPTLLVGFFAGVFVDRANKRLMMLWMDGLRVVIVALLILATGVIPLPGLASGRLPLLWALGAIYAVVALVNAGEQFFRPSAMAIIQEVVPQEQQARAMGFSQVSVSLALIIGPAAAAPLYAAFGPEWALLIDAATFVVSYITIYLLRAPRHATVSQASAPHAANATHAAPRHGFWREMWAGMRFYFSNRPLVTLLIAVIVAVAGASALNTLDVYYATQNLHATTAMYGLIGGVFGLGAILGSIIFGLTAQRIGLARTLWLALAVFGLLVVGLTQVTNYEVALGFFLVAGALNSGLNVAAGPIMMRETPPALMGRVMSIFNPASSLAILLATAGVGYLAGITLRDFHAVWLDLPFGTISVIYLGGGVLMTLSGIVVLIGLVGVDRRYRHEDREAAQAARAAEAAATSQVATVTA